MGMPALRDEPTGPPVSEAPDPSVTSSPAPTVTVTHTVEATKTVYSPTPVPSPVRVTSTATVTQTPTPSVSVSIQVKYRDRIKEVPVPAPQQMPSIPPEPSSTTREQWASLPPALPRETQNKREIIVINPNPVSGDVPGSMWAFTGVAVVIVLAVLTGIIIMVMRGKL